MIPVSYNVRSLLVRRTTTIATAFGIALVVFVLSSALMLGKGIKRTLGSSGSPDQALVLRKGSDAELASGIESQSISLIMAAPGIKKDTDGKPLAAAEVVVVIALEKVGAGEGAVSNLQVRGVEPASLKVRPMLRVIEGRPPQLGTDEVMIGKGIRGRFKGVDMGQSFELKKNRPVKIVGVFQAGGSSLESEVWADIDTVRTSFGRGSSASSVTAALESRTKYDAFEAYIENDKQLGLDAFRETEYYEKQSEGTSIFITVMGLVFAFFLSLGAMIGAMITMYAAVSQRSKEIGTLRALGFSRSSILISFLFESAFLALLGGAIGAVASLGMTAASFSMVNFATWQEITFSFDPTPAIILGATAAGAAMGIIGGFFPAIRAARLSPIVAMRA
jgi:putative ABC transport system permease protein